MLFPSLGDVTRVWKKVVGALVDNRLGSTVKVATDESTQCDRLICIYTKVLLLSTCMLGAKLTR
jgi:hypothetical protein